jgi:hypothetical protein
LCVCPLLLLSRRPLLTKKKEKRAAKKMIHQAATTRSLLGRVADREVVREVVPEVVREMVVAVESSGVVSSAMIRSLPCARSASSRTGPAMRRPLARLQQRLLIALEGGTLGYRLTLG